MLPALTESEQPNSINSVRGGCYKDRARKEADGTNGAVRYGGQRRLLCGGDS